MSLRAYISPISTSLCVYLLYFPIPGSGMASSAYLPPLYDSVLAAVTPKESFGWHSLLVDYSLCSSSSYWKKPDWLSLAYESLIYPWGCVSIPM